MIGAFFAVYMLLAAFDVCKKINIAALPYSLLICLTTPIGIALSVNQLFLSESLLYGISAGLCLLAQGALNVYCIYRIIFNAEGDEHNKPLADRRLSVCGVLCYVVYVLLHILMFPTIISLTHFSVTKLLNPMSLFVLLLNIDNYGVQVASTISEETFTSLIILVILLRSGIAVSWIMSTICSVRFAFRKFKSSGGRIAFGILGFMPVANFFTAIICAVFSRNKKEGL